MTAPAGWYGDPQSPDQQRYWDGQQWTDQRQPVPTGPAPSAAPAQTLVAPAVPAKKSHTTRNVILAVIGVFILLMGGCTIALIAAGGSAINEAIDEAEQSDQAPGGPDNPMEIQVGEAFEVQGFSYQAGWTVKNVFGSVEIKGLRVENNRDERDSALVEIKFWKGTELLALVACSTLPIDPGRTAALNCLSENWPANYDKVSINDTF